MLNQICLIVVVFISRFLTFLVKLTGKGNGTALPGLLVELYIPWVIIPIAKQLKQVIFISGTNGKTTTRALLVEVLEKQGISLITNRGGANIFRGIASALLLNTNWLGRVNHSFAILEVEEATMPKLAKYLPPNILVLTNLFRDQLDAYGEVDKTIEYFQQTIAIANPTLIANSDDVKLVNGVIQKNTVWHGFCVQQAAEFRPNFEGEQLAELNENQKATNLTNITNIQPKNGVYNFTIQNKNQQYNASTLLPGRYNLYNVAAAVATIEILRSSGYYQHSSLVEDIEYIQQFQPVFGRGEQIQFEKNTTTLMLVKNPAGFNQVLQWIEEMYENTPFHLDICINDNIADGKDVSWLWDVDMESFCKKFTEKKLTLESIHTAGTRGFDMALRLQYAGFEINKQQVYNSISELAKNLPTRNKPSIILCTYTSLLSLRKAIGEFKKLPNINNSGN